MTPISIVFLIVALILFFLGAWSRWWTPDPRGPFYPAFVSLGLFFLTLGYLWPQISK